MKKISIILPALGGGGAERLHVNLAKDWLQRGFKVEFVLMRKEGERREELLSLLPTEIPIVNFGINHTPQILLPLAKHLRTSSPNVILVPMWPITSYSIIAWILSGKIGKLYVSDHIQLSITAMHEINVPQLYLKWSIRLTYPFANGVIAVSNGVKKDLSKISGFKENKIKVIYNPVATGVSSYRESQDVRVKLWGGNYTYNILSVGNLKKQKDHETLLKAFSLLPKELNAKLVILGEGKLRNHLSMLIEKLGLLDRVDLPGFVLDPLPWFRSADLFVLSSLWEGFGNVLVESLESGVPVVSTDCPSGPAEILDNGRYGKLVSPANPQALASTIKSSLFETHDRTALMLRAKDFLIANISKQYLEYMGLM